MNNRSKLTRFDKVLVWTCFVFSLIVITLPVCGCGGDSFVFEKFGKRCLYIANMIQELKVAQIMDLPNKADIKGKLLNEWIDFYLSHGNKPPGNIASIATNSWKICIKNSGKLLSDIAYEKVDSKKADLAIIPFYLLGQPEKMKGVHSIISSWSILISKLPENNIASTTIWLQTNLKYLDTLRREFSAFKNFNMELRQFIFNIWQNWQYVLSATGDAQKTAMKFSFVELSEKIKTKYREWKLLTFQ